MRGGDDASRHSRLGQGTAPRTDRARSRLRPWPAHGARAVRAGVPHGRADSTRLGRARISHPADMHVRVYKMRPRCRAARAAGSGTVPTTALHLMHRHADAPSQTACTRTSLDEPRRTERPEALTLALAELLAQADDARDAHDEGGRADDEGDDEDDERGAPEALDESV